MIGSPFARCSHFIICFLHPPHFDRVLYHTSYTLSYLLRNEKIIIDMVP